MKYNETNETLIDYDSCSSFPFPRKDIETKKKPDNSNILPEIRKAKKLISLTNTNVYKCDEFGYSTTNKTWLERHIKAVHQKLKDFTCSECHCAGSRKNTLTRYIKTIHGVE